MNPRSTWFDYCGAEPQGAPALRMFCFHYGGARAAMFRSWLGWLPAGVELVAIELPGHGNRMAEPLERSMDAISEPLADAVEPLLEVPYAIFGHSTGALIGYELARVLRRRGKPDPALLLVASQNAPAVRPNNFKHHLPDEEFAEVLRSYDGTPREILEHPELLDFLLPPIKADGAVFETYVYRREVPFEFPITVFFGQDDGLVSEAAVARWTEETSGPFRCVKLPGGHFFVADEGRFSAGVIRELAAAAPLQSMKLAAGGA